MKGGGYFYQRRTKQLSLFFVGVVFTTIVVWHWEKTPLLTTFLPSHGQVLQLFPAGEVKAKQIDDLREADVVVNLVSPSSSISTPSLDAPSRNVGVVDSVSPLSSINTPSLDIQTDGYSQKKHHENTTNMVEKPVSSEVSSDSKPPQQQLVEPMPPKKLDSAAGREVDGVPMTNVEKQENTTSFVENPVSSEVSVRYNNSEPPQQQLVEPMAPKKVDSTVGREDVGVPMSNVEKQVCNFGKGRWVADENRPLYSVVVGMWACRLTQRIDFAYEKLKWHPKDCDMDDFTGAKFLKKMQDKTLAFIGDSLGRQQFQSLMCMLTGGEETHDVADVGKEYGLVKARGSVRPDGWAYRFQKTNTTILYYWSASLCDLEPLDPTNRTTYFAMHLDRPPAFLKRFLSRFHVVVLNTGHHWNRGKINGNRWVMYVGGKPNTNRRIADIGGARNFTIYSIVSWMNGELQKRRGGDLKALYRSISPRHFFNGDWNSGGTCDSTTPGALEVVQDESSDPIASGAVKGTDVKLLDITALSQLREEGHISRYSIRPTPGMQDCLHWCLPAFPTHGMNSFLHKYEQILIKEEMPYALYMVNMSASNINSILEENQYPYPYPYPSHVFVPNFVSVKLSDRDKYGVWKTQMLCLLESHGMLDFINHGPPNFFPTATAADEKLWRRSDALVKGWILGSLSEETAACLVDNFHSQADNFTARHVWINLAAMYAPQQHAASDDRTDGDCGERRNKMIRDEKKIHQELYLAVERRRWKKIKSILKTKQVKLTDSISINGNTALHVAVGCHTKKNGFLTKMLDLNEADQNSNNRRLQLDSVRNSDGSTLLHLAASLGNLDAAGILVERNRDLLSAKDNQGLTPLDILPDHKNTNTYLYLLARSTMPLPDPEQANVHETRPLINAIDCEDFVWQTPTLTFVTRAAFDYDVSSIFELNFIKLLIVLLGAVFNYFKKRAESRKAARKLLEKVCDLIIKDSSNRNSNKDYSKAIFEAVKRDAGDFVQQVVFWFPNAMKKVDEDGHNIAQVALINRSLKVMAVITHREWAKHTNLSQNLETPNSFGNNLLHFAARLAPANQLNHISGAALQMKYELEWFKLAKEYLPLCMKKKNRFGETPEMLFTREHNGLVVKGEKWLKDTANSGLVTATLLTTITFAAAITVPGGNDDEDGTPTLGHKVAFKLFAVSNALSMLSSATSLLLFLSIFTSPFGEKDFGLRLHLRLISAFAALFISAELMIAAFGATLALLFEDIVYWIIPLTWLPVSCFALYLNSLVQVPLEMAIRLLQRLRLLHKWYKLCMDTIN
ncbi:hypothetical protein OSB04_015307 [Centaurea solstitialis]|uniref:PGG domain-containing protein n=1 Tax=Centaurea solstitialis TaxID=347529 RepID=A0AA38TH08_9ASTR|nr:hypothetical protein OSB04_015307 [Centaurea solstitialis]